MTSTNVEDNICNRSERVSNGPRRKQRKFTEPLNFGPPTQVCEHCGAQLWYEERTLKSKKPKKPKFSLCCSEGRIQLPILKDPPPFLERLLNLNNDQRSMKFRLGIRIYNSLFAFTSLGGSVDNSVNNGSAPYVFRLNGQNHHRIGSLIPVDGQRPKFAQLYIYDTENEVTNRIGSIIGDNSRNTVDQDIVAGLLEMLDQCNSLVKYFRMARDRFNESEIHDVRIRLIGNRNSDGRQYNFPTTSEVAAIIVGDFNIESCNRDIIVENRSLGLQRINGSHPSFMALQYPLLFPYGEDGYMFGIPYRNFVGGNSRKRESVTMREYYAYRLQQRSHEGTTLLLGGRLFQQFIVDAYTCIEEERLQWVRRNQKKLRSELYSGLKDAILRGDTNPITVGKRIILPSSFTGSPRYMVQNYQDAMAICRSAGYPDLFITFTCNPKWPEIALFLESIEDFPTKWVWHNNVKQWQRRKSGNCIGRVYYAHPSSGEKFYLRMLLNIIKGPRNFKEIRTVNNVTYPTYKDACYALGLLDNDNEWHDCMIEASNWASGKQLRQLFVTILMFCEVSDTLNLWESNWKLLTEDILNRQRNVLQFHELILSENQLRNYGLYEIEQILQQYGRSLKDYPQMPQPDLDIIIHNGNRLIQEEMSYNISSLKREHEILFSGLNNEQRPIYNSIMEAVTLERGGMFFVYGHGGTGKTYLYRTILSAIRSKGKIALAVASSGIAALLLPGGRTAHSRFHIPINVNDDSTCDIKQRSQTAELLSKTSIILWDEAPMAHRNCFEALDRSLRDILQLEDPQSVEKPFGGKVVVLGGDFRQILPVVKKGKREDIVYFAISDGEFGEEDDDNKITIPNDLIIQSTENPMQDIIDSIYPDLKVKYKDPSYLQDRAILAPTNEVVEELNDYIISSLNEEEHEYLSSDSVCKASSNVADQDVLYPVEFLNTLRFPGLPNHKLTLKVDIIGKVVGIGPIEHPYIKGSNVSMRNINVITTEGNKIRLTLWGSIANQVEDNFCTDNAGPVIIVVTSLIVKAFKGENYLSSTSGTKVYINLDIPETARFMDKQVEDTHSIQEMPRQFKSQRTIEEEMNINRRTITEITNIVGDSDNKEHEELDLPVQIENLIGKTFVFQLELNDFNLLHGWQFFTVKTVFDSILQSDNAFKLDKITECYMSAASNDDLSNLSSEGDDDYAKLQRIDNANDTQLTTTSTITENERNYSLTNAEQKKKKQRIV
uniref:ATP-dependent DNA helicase n=1 Tax=Fagus sylvatica TaxID=28930 RepID=A0A2N9J2K3_FAGSY